MSHTGNFLFVSITPFLPLVTLILLLDLLYAVLLTTTSDLKLENLVLARAGDLSSVTITDFGLAKVLH